MEENNKKQNPVRITYELLKKDVISGKSQDKLNSSDIIPGDETGVVTHKQKRVLVAFVEEQGKEGATIMCGTRKDNQDEREIMESVGNGMWREVAIMLNSARVGGCVKSPQEWKKYWQYLMGNIKDSVNRLQEKNVNFKLESLPLLNRRIYKLATNQYEGRENSGNNLKQLEGSTEDAPGIVTLLKELADKISLGEHNDCDKLLDRVTRSELDFDSVYLEDGGESAVELDGELSGDEDTFAQLKNSSNVKSRKRKRLPDISQDREAKAFNTKYQSTINYLRLKQEKLKVSLLEKEIELRSLEMEHKKQIHEAELKRRQVEIVHLDAMHNKILHMSHL